jgi:hypothetical protein
MRRPTLPDHQHEFKALPPVPLNRVEFGECAGSGEAGMKEKDIQKAILDYLQARGVLAFRINTGAMQSEYNGRKRFMRFGTPGMADVLAFSIFGETFWIECKSPTGKQSELQKSFQHQVEDYGHKYVLARSVDDVIGALQC